MLEIHYVVNLDVYERYEIVPARLWGELHRHCFVHNCRGPRYMSGQDNAMDLFPDGAVIVNGEVWIYGRRKGSW